MHQGETRVRIPPWCVLRYVYKKRMRKIKTEVLDIFSFSSLLCGMDGTRTRDPLRDRQVF